MWFAEPACENVKALIECCVLSQLQLPAFGICSDPLFVSKTRMSGEIKSC